MLPAQHRVGLPPAITELASTRVLRQARQCHMHHHTLERRATPSSARARHACAPRLPGKSRCGRQSTCAAGPVSGSNKLRLLLACCTPRTPPDLDDAAAAVEKDAHHMRASNVQSQSRAIALTSELAHARLRLEGTLSMGGGVCWCVASAPLCINVSALVLRLCVRVPACDSRWPA
jgi:hypothetical protein